MRTRGRGRNAASRAFIACLLFHSWISPLLFLRSLQNIFHFSFLVNKLSAAIKMRTMEEAEEYGGLPGPVIRPHINEFDIDKTTPRQAIVSLNMKVRHYSSPKYVLFANYLHLIHSLFFVVYVLRIGWMCARFTMWRKAMFPIGWTVRLQTRGRRKARQQQSGWISHPPLTKHLCNLSSSGGWESLKLTPDDAPPTAPPPTRPTPRRGERQHDNQSANKRQTGGEAPVDKRRRGVKRQWLRVKRRGGRVKRTRGGGVNVTTSWQTRGKQEGTAPQKLAGLSRGQEAAAAARREAS